MIAVSLWKSDSLQKVHFLNYSYTISCHFQTISTSDTTIYLHNNVILSCLTSGIIWGQSILILYITLSVSLQWSCLYLYSVQVSVDSGCYVKFRVVWSKIWQSIINFSSLCSQIQNETHPTWDLKYNCRSLRLYNFSGTIHSSCQAYNRPDTKVV